MTMAHVLPTLTLLVTTASLIAWTWFAVFMLF